MKHLDNKIFFRLRSLYNKSDTIFLYGRNLYVIYIPMIVRFGRGKDFF